MPFSPMAILGGGERGGGGDAKTERGEGEGIMTEEEGDQERTMRLGTGEWKFQTWLHEGMESQRKRLNGNSHNHCTFTPMCGPFG